MLVKNPKRRFSSNELINSLQKITEMEKNIEITINVAQN